MSACSSPKPTSTPVRNHEGLGALGANATGLRRLGGSHFEKTNKKVASHTLRRFFGLVAFDGQFRKSTLDNLANYVGYESCDDFLDRLKQEEDLVELLVRLQVQNVEIDEHKLLSITAQQWMEESVKKQTELAMAWILAKRGKIAESKATLGVLKDTTFPRDYQGTSRLIIEATEALLQP